MIGRRSALLVIAVVAAVGLSMVPTEAPDVRAATPGLTIVSTARYDVQPEAHRVHVTLNLQLTNRLRDSNPFDLVIANHGGNARSRALWVR